MTASIAKMIDGIPPDGEWWKQSSRDTFIAVACDLLAYDVDHDEVEYILTRLYHAVATIYGD